MSSWFRTRRRSGLLLISLLGFDPRRYRDTLDQNPAALNIVDFKDPAHARLTLFNDTSHYADAGLAIPGVPKARLSPWWGHTKASPDNSSANLSARSETRLQSAFDALDEIIVSADFRQVVQIERHVVIQRGGQTQADQRAVATRIGALDAESRRARDVQLAAEIEIVVQELTLKSHR